MIVKINSAVNGTMVYVLIIFVMIIMKVIVIIFLNVDGIMVLVVVHGKKK